MCGPGPGQFVIGSSPAASSCCSMQKGCLSPTLSLSFSHTNSHKSAACQQTANSSVCVVWQRLSWPARLTLSGPGSLHNLRERYKRWATPHVSWDTLYTAWQLQPHGSTSKNCKSSMQYMQTHGIFHVSVIIYRYYMVGGLVMWIKEESSQIKWHFPTLFFFCL